MGSLTDERRTIEGESCCLLGTRTSKRRKCVRIYRIGNHTLLTFLTTSHKPQIPASLVAIVKKSPTRVALCYQDELKAPSNMKTSTSLNHTRPLAFLSKAGWFGIAVALLAINSVPIRADLVAHWTFDEAGGTVAHDSAGGLDGALSPSGAGFVA